MDSSMYEYEEYRAVNHEVDEFPPEDQSQEPGAVSGFFDSLNTITTGIVDTIAGPEEDEHRVQEEPRPAPEPEEKGLFDKLTSFEITSPFSEEEVEEEIELIPQEEEKKAKDSKRGSIFKKITTRFDGTKEDGYNVKTGSGQDDTEELKDAPKVSNMVQMFEGMTGRKVQEETSNSEKTAEDEIAAEKKRAKEKQKRTEGGSSSGLLNKLPSFHLGGGEDKKQKEAAQEPPPPAEPAPVESKGLMDSFLDTFSSHDEEAPKENGMEEKREAAARPGLMDRLAAAISFDEGPDGPYMADPEEGQPPREVNEASEPSLFDQVTTSITHTLVGETDGQENKPVEYYD